METPEHLAALAGAAKAGKPIEKLEEGAPTMESVRRQAVRNLNLARQYVEFQKVGKGMVIFAAVLGGMVGGSTWVIAKREKALAKERRLRRGH